VSPAPAQTQSVAEPPEGDDDSPDTSLSGTTRLQGEGAEADADAGDD
jgi:hypothetical protein